MKKVKAKAKTAPARVPAKRGRKCNLDTAKFIEVYLTTSNQATAAKAAGSQAKTRESLTVIGAQLLRRPKIAAEVKRIRDLATAEAEITVAKVMKELARVCFYDPRKFFQDDGSPKDIQSLDDGTARVLSSLDVEALYEGSGNERQRVGTTVKYRFMDKVAALDKAMRHLGLYEQDNNQGADALARVVFKISAKAKGPR